MAAGHPIHVVVAWLGSSIKVAKAHYLQVTDADFAKAIAKGNAQDNAAGVGESLKSSAEDGQDNAQKRA